MFGRNFQKTSEILDRLVGNLEKIGEILGDSKEHPMNF